MFTSRVTMLNLLYETAQSLYISIGIYCYRQFKHELPADYGQL